METGVLRETKLGKIDDKADRERAGVEYTLDYIEAHESELRAVFVPDGTPEEEVPELLYTKLTQCFDWIAADATRVVGVCYSHMTRIQVQEDRQPLIQLGWARHLPCFGGSEAKADDESFPYSLTATIEGIAIVDGLRTAQRYVTLAEQRKANANR